MLAVVCAIAALTSLACFELIDLRRWVDGNTIAGLSLGGWASAREVAHEIARWVARIAWYAGEICDVLLLAASTLLVVRPRAGLRWLVVYVYSKLAVCTVLGLGESYYWDVLNRGTYFVFTDEFPAMPIGRVLMVAGVSAVFPLLLGCAIGVVRRNIDSPPPRRIYARLAVTLVLPALMVPASVYAIVYRHNAAVVNAAWPVAKAPPSPPFQLNRTILGNEFDESIGGKAEGGRLSFPAAGYARYRNVFFEPRATCFHAEVYDPSTPFSFAVRLDSVTAPPIAVIKNPRHVRALFIEAPLDPPVTGVHDVYITCDYAASVILLTSFSFHDRAPKMLGP